MIKIKGLYLFEYIVWNNRNVGIKYNNWEYVLDQEYVKIDLKDKALLLSNAWTLQSFLNIKYLYPENKNLYSESIVFNQFLKLNNIVDNNIINKHYNIFNNMIKNVLLNGNQKYLKFARKFPIEYRYYAYQLCCYYSDDKMYNNLVKCPQLVLENSEYNKMYCKSTYPNLYIQPKNIYIYNTILEMNKYMNYSLNVYEQFINCKHQTIMLKIIKLLQNYRVEKNLVFLSYIYKNILLLKNKLRKDIQILNIVIIIYDMFLKNLNIIEKDINVLLEYIEMDHICNN